MAQITSNVAVPQSGNMYYIANVGHLVFLENDSPSTVRVWNGGRSMDEIITEDSNQPNQSSLRWLLHFNISNDSYFLVNLKNPIPSVLCSEGNSCFVLENKSNIELNQLPNKFQWKIIPCPHQNGCFYIVNCDENKFLDTHGTEVSLWNNNGCDIQTIIYGNTSPYAKNIRWYLVPCTPTQTPTPFPPSKKLRILHLSDTHSMHKTIETKFPMPPADILLHTGDFSNRGSEEEYKFFNEWLGELKMRYPVIIVILGNHDRWSKLDFPTSRSLLYNATVLDNEEVQVNGLRIYGQSWDIQQPDGSPDDKVSPEYFMKIPENIDILMTHCPPYQIFDKVDHKNSWGSSNILRQVIEKRCPKVHLFGHLHEQRGVWIKNADTSEYSGGVEFKPWLFPNNPPPSTYPCQIISCNAMKNHGLWDNLPSCIAGPARLFTASQEKDGDWTFSTTTTA